MFKSVFKFLDPYPQDDLSERIEKEPGVSKSLYLLAGALVFSTLSMLLAGANMWKLRNPSYPLVYSVLMKDGQRAGKPEEIDTLGYPHQSFRNVQGWVVDAIAASYSFDFYNFDQQVKNAEYYFTSGGYASYLRALRGVDMEGKIKKQQLVVSIVPTREPVATNSAGLGENYYWWVRVPVLVSYSGGKKPVLSNYNIDVLIVRTPPYKNHRGLAIAQFNMSGE